MANNKKLMEVACEKSARAIDKIKSYLRKDDFSNSAISDMKSYAQELERNGKKISDILENVGIEKRYMT